MEYLLILFAILHIVQAMYIKHLKKEIALRDGTYNPKPNKFLEWLKSLFWM